jgi:hypothetical protein
MRQHSAMFASSEEAPAEISDLCDDPFILFEAWQHVAEMANATLHPGTILLALAGHLEGASTRKAVSSPRRSQC